MWFSSGSWDCICFLFVSLCGETLLQHASWYCLEAGTRWCIFLLAIILFFVKVLNLSCGRLWKPFCNGLWLIPILRLDACGESTKSFYCCRGLIFCRFRSDSSSGHPIGDRIWGTNGDWCYVPYFVFGNLVYGYGFEWGATRVRGCAGSI